MTKRRYASVKDSALRLSLSVPLREAMICWNPGTADVQVCFHPDHSGHAKGLRMSAGAVYGDWCEFSPEIRLVQLFGEMLTIIVRDGVPFEALHDELCFIPEYRRLFAPDTP